LAAGRLPFGEGFRGHGRGHHLGLSSVWLSPFPNMFACYFGSDDVCDCSAGSYRIPIGGGTTTWRCLSPFGSLNTTASGPLEWLSRREIHSFLWTLPSHQQTVLGLSTGLGRDICMASKHTRPMNIIHINHYDFDFPIGTSFVGRAVAVVGAGRFRLPRLPANARNLCFLASSGDGRTGKIGAIVVLLLLTTLSGEKALCAINRSSSVGGSRGIDRPFSSRSFFSSASSFFRFCTITEAHVC